MRAIRTSIFSAALLLCTAGFIWTSEAEMQNTDFWTDAAESSLAEVALSNVALQKAQSDAVKQFAQQMVTDHTQANQELAAAAQAKGVTIPTALPDKRQRDVTELNGLDAARFDREYMKMMVKDHERASSQALRTAGPARHRRGREGTRRQAITHASGPSDNGAFALRHSSRRPGRQFVRR